MSANGYFLVIFFPLFAAVCVTFVVLEVRYARADSRRLAALARRDRIARLERELLDRPEQGQTNDFQVFG